MTATLDTASPSRLFRAFADPTRLRILRLLRDGELCVCDLMQALRAPQAKTSRHLAYLRRAGLVKARDDGQWAYYSLTAPRDAFHRKLLDCLSACFSGLPEMKADARRARRVRSCCP
jgi:ArsR family transcriptional regulator